MLGKPPWVKPSGPRMAFVCDLSGLIRTYTVRQSRVLLPWWLIDSRWCTSPPPAGVGKG
jgi:hypothetical protein